MKGPKSRSRRARRRDRKDCSSGLCISRPRAAGWYITFCFPVLGGVGAQERAIRAAMRKAESAGGRGCSAERRMQHPIYMGVSQSYRYLSGGPHNKDYSILGSILGFPLFWESTTSKPLMSRMQTTYGLFQEDGGVLGSLFGTQL